MLVYEENSLSKTLRKSANLLPVNKKDVTSSPVLTACSKRSSDSE